METSQSLTSIIDTIVDSPYLVIPPQLQKLTGDLTCAAMLSRILYYHTKIGSWFAMSIPTWQQELCATYYSVVASIKYLECTGVVQTRIAPENGKLTTHFNIDLDKLDAWLHPVKNAVVSTTTTNVDPNEPYMWIPAQTLEPGDEIAVYQNQHPVVNEGCNCQHPRENAGCNCQDPVENTVVNPNPRENEGVIPPQHDNYAKKIFWGAGVNPVKTLTLLTTGFNVNTKDSVLKELMFNGLKESLSHILASLGCESAAKNAAAHTFAPAAVFAFAPRMQADLAFANQLQPTLLDLPQPSESTRESKDPRANPTKKIAMRNKINPPKIPDLAGKLPKSRRTKAPPDPLLQAVSVMAYRYVAKVQIPVCARQVVVDTVGNDPKNLKLWENIIRQWIMRGYNPRNIDGMLEAFKAGGLRPNGNGGYNRASTAPAGYTPRSAASNPHDPDGYIQNHTPKDVWEKTNGDIKLCTDYINLKANPRMRGQEWAVKALAALKAKGVEV